MRLFSRQEDHRAWVGFGPSQGRSWAGPAAVVFAGEGDPLSVRGPVRVELVPDVGREPARGSDVSRKFSERRRFRVLGYFVVLAQVPHDATLTPVTSAKQASTDAMPSQPQISARR